MYISCAAPPPQQARVEQVMPEIYENTEPPPEDYVESPPEIEPVGFDLNNITPELYNETKENIVNFINELNVIIKSHDYDAWLLHIDNDYYEYISSAAYLQRVSASGILQARGIVLSDAYDYFMNVVVPSRSNDRVDDIEFISNNRVKAITVNRGRRLLLYDLEKTKDGWKIVIPNSKNS
jgi:hypothetical protein